MSATPTHATLEGRGLRKRYGSLVAVDGVSLALEPGRVLGLLGPKRAGKTTTVASLAGQGAPLHDALRGGGRAAGRSRRDHRPRPGDRRRHAGGALARPRRDLTGEGLPGPDGPEPARRMILTALVAMVRKDLRLFLADRRALVMAFAAPIAIA